MPRDGVHSLAVDQDVADRFHDQRPQDATVSEWLDHLMDLAPYDDDGVDSLDDAIESTQQTSSRKFSTSDHDSERLADAPLAQGPNYETVHVADAQLDALVDRIADRVSTIIHTEGREIARAVVREELRESGDS